jgi:hypothetical protein
MAISFYNAGDNAIYDSGQHFVPQEKYRLGYTPKPLTNMPVNGGITNTKAFNNSGNDFSVYNPDPNSIVNREYRPNYDYRQFSEYGSDPSTADIKKMDMNQNYFNKPPPSKMEGLMSMIPGAGIAKFLANQIGPYMPTNRRAIMENELSGQGIMVNDIGQIVQGDGAYDTAGNVMAGYNANKLTAKSFDDRIAMAEKNMSAENKKARIEALKEAKAAWEKATGRSDTIYDFEEEEKKKNKKNTVINRFLTEKKETKTAADAQAAVANQNKVEAYTGQKMSDYRASRPRSEQNYTGGDTNSNPSTPGAQDSFSNKSGMGRTGYFFGGRVNYKAGGRTDAESQYGADSAGSYDSSQNKSGREQSYGGGNNTPVSNYDYSQLIDRYKEKPDYALKDIELNKNLTSNTKLNTILNLQKTVEDKELAGQLELDKRLGPVDTRLTYGTDQKPKLSASYMNYSPTFGGIYANADSSDGLGVNYAYNGIGANANFDNSGKFERAGITYDNNGVALGLDTQDGVTASYSKDIFDGTGQIKAGGRYDPITGEYNAEGKISFPFANGGLAGLL